MIIKPNRADIVAENDSPIGKYVFGEQQQLFHKDTGWYRTDDVLIEESIYAENLLIETWHTVVDETAGV